MSLDFALQHLSLSISVSFLNFLSLPPGFANPSRPLDICTVIDTAICLDLLARGVKSASITVIGRASATIRLELNNTSGIDPNRNSNEGRL